MIAGGAEGGSHRLITEPVIDDLMPIHDGDGVGFDLTLAGESQHTIIRLQVIGFLGPCVEALIAPYMMLSGHETAILAWNLLTMASISEPGP